ncbi:hypothetical protein CONPUDRAFT_155085 [Coniophora puteana RWD-64-598 SS2]|uniref:Uncharacterized protein n=1 Tax=Coniophora puteana (strain RWD-64-598) TaxID=741705 RepID=A0A5M3ML51_CONPW|nr:uncharacterized protein CONPUDRAFT_155085 [Coniophora puteana RWD-64-598 SS2]EIW79690.1 hypothetical protein CONPUDRAFT_155085 [Coniophora puteana RWD-64-598 SS2]
MSDYSLDDSSQVAVYIPYSGDDDDQDHTSYSLYPERDWPGSYERRLNEYRAAWGRCLQRMQEIIYSVHSEVIDAVVSKVNSAYAEPFHGLPFPEIPVVSVNATSSNAAVFDQIAAKLEHDEEDALFGSKRHFVAHIFPGACTSVMAAMKTLVSGFVSRSPLGDEEGGIRRKPSTSLASFDINLLAAWCDAAQETHGTLQLVAILHNFEQFDPLVMQDVFEICNLHIPRIPLVFVLGLASSSASYVHAAYPSSTLALLRLDSCALPPPADVLHRVIRRTFLDVDFDPGVMIGPAVLDFLLDFFTRQSCSLDGAVSILQIAFMKHFEDPLTALLTSSSALLSDVARNGNKIKKTHKDRTAFVSSVLARVRTSSLSAASSSDNNDDTNDPPTLAACVDAARAQCSKHLRLLRFAFQTLLRVRTALQRTGRRMLQLDKDEPGMVRAALRGALGLEVKVVCRELRMLPYESAKTVLDELYVHLCGAPEDVLSAEEEIRTRIDTARQQLSPEQDYDEDDGEEEKEDSALAMAGEWLQEYLLSRLRSPEELPLWDIWCMGSTPFPSEVFNPSIHASLISGLLHPQAYLLPVPSASDPSSPRLDGHDRIQNGGGGEDGEGDALDVPDTTLLFRGYLESGKTINAYDWYASFSVALENQRAMRRVRQRQRDLDTGVDVDADASVTPKKGTKKAVVNGRGSGSPSKKRTPSGKGKERMQAEGEVEDDDLEEGEDEDEEKDEEAWGMEMQARFIRGLHELDYMGFVKHKTKGKKAEHVVKTVFDPPEPEI